MMQTFSIPNPASDPTRSVPHQVALRWQKLFPTRKVKLEINGEWVKKPATLLTPCKRHRAFYGIVTVIVLAASSVASMVPKSIALTTS